MVGQGRVGRLASESGLEMNGSKLASVLKNAVDGKRNELAWELVYLFLLTLLQYYG